MAVSTVSSLSESFVSGAPEERSSGHIHKPEGDVLSSDDETGGHAERGASDDGGQNSVVDQHERSPPQVETQQPA